MDSQKIRSFRVRIPDNEIEELTARLRNSRWPKEDLTSSWDRGVPAWYLKKLSDHLVNRYDWRKQEEQLNRYPQFMVTIDGQQIHFYHVLSGESNARPLLLLHGYPGSVTEMMGIIDKLTDPAVYGGKHGDAFHLVIPSLPGYGFSTPLHSPGWDMHRTAGALVSLMQQLGYQEYGIQAGDIGAGVAQWIGALDPGHVTGIHLNADASSVAILGSPLPSLEHGKLPESRWKRLEKLHMVQKEGRGYLQLLSTRPLTVSYALNDSPLGLLAWIAEKFREWADNTLSPEGIDMDALLTNVCLYWFTGTSFSAANMIYENYHSSMGWAAPENVPTGFLAFDVEGVIRGMFDPGKNIGHWSESEQGGHFPSLEVPEILVADIRKFFNSL